MKILETFAVPPAGPAPISDSGEELGGSISTGDPTPKAFDKNKIFKGIDTSKSTASDADVQKLFNTAFLWAGIICVLIIVVAGLKYTTSAGDSGKVTTAKNTLLNAIIGLVLIIFAFAITNFILSVL